MPKNRVSSFTLNANPAPPQGHAAPAPVSWRRLVSMGLLTGATRHIGSLLVGLALAWWHRD
ncbi:hypothetical protein ACFYWN_44010 [Streptomyces sp. NPDC002917]|uniref:hypothetical protein n=1 Tax=Streptomyces sp. NPDC002917 TaxID=3364671 RepID=UPI0036BDCAD4